MVEEKQCNSDERSLSLDFERILQSKATLEGKDRVEFLNRLLSSK